MTCCGDRRRQLAGAPSVRVGPYAELAKATGSTAPMRYRGPYPMVLRGPTSKYIYRLARSDERIDVDVRDVAAFQRTGWFVLGVTETP